MLATIQAEAREPACRDWTVMAPVATASAKNATVCTSAIMARLRLVRITYRRMYRPTNTLTTKDTKGLPKSPKLPKVKDRTKTFTTEDTHSPPSGRSGQAAEHG